MVYKSATSPDLRHPLLPMRMYLPDLLPGSDLLPNKGFRPAHGSENDLRSPADPDR